MYFANSPNPITLFQAGERMPLDLAVVMPVYNEQDCIAQVLRAWLAMLDDLRCAYRVIILNDGSKDRTADALAPFHADKRCEIVTKPNSGHGPTILAGYGKAVDIAEWVFQCDSDDEIGPEHFPQLWRRRNDFDALMGIRVNRNQPFARALVSAASRMIVGLLFGAGVSDVNVPYRLIRADLLKQMIAQIPGGTFSPNLVISGALSRAHARIFQMPVQHRVRATGSASMVKITLLKAALRAFWQTLWCRPRLDLGKGDAPTQHAPFTTEH